MRTRKIVALGLVGAMVVSVLTGCGINKNDTIATFSDGTKVTLGIANFSARYQQAANDELYRSILGDDVWTQDLYGNGSTMQESVKEEMIEELHEMYTLKAHMSDYSVSLTDDEKKAIADTVAAFMDANQPEVLREIGATTDIVEEYLTLHTIKSKMHDAIIVDADTNVSDEEANMRAYTMLSFPTSGYYDESYNYVAYTDEEVAEIEQDAEDVFNAITAPEDLESVAEEHGYSATTGTYDADNTSLSEDLKTTLDELAEGEMSDLISTDSGKYIVRLDAETDEEATESNRESIISERQSDLYDEVLAGWQENDGWTVEEKAVAKIEFKNMFNAPEEDTTEDSGDNSVETETTEE